MNNRPTSGLPESMRRMDMSNLARPETLAAFSFISALVSKCAWEWQADFGVPAGWLILGVSLLAAVGAVCLLLRPICQATPYLVGRVVLMTLTALVVCMYVYSDVDGRLVLKELGAESAAGLLSPSFLVHADSRPRVERRGDVWHWQHERKAGNVPDVVVGEIIRQKKRKAVKWGRRD